jgi:tetratricopeptide (TPR) repeat protein
MFILTLVTALSLLQDADDYLREGALKYGRGDMKGAIREWSRAIELRPGFTEAWRNRGLARFRLEQYGEAIRDYDRALKLKPNDPSILYNRGHARHYDRNFSGAIGDYTRAIDAGFGGADAYHYRGHARRASDDPRGALRDHEKGIGREPGSAWGHASLGYAEFDLPMPKRALASFRRAIELKSPEADYLHLRTWLLLFDKEGRAKADKTLRDHLSRRAPKTDDDWYHALATFLLREKSAEELVREASTPERKCEAWFLVGWKHRVEGRGEAARKAYRSCVATGISEFTEHASARAELERLADRRK